MQMKVQTTHWTRAMAMESWSMGEDYSLVRILEPKKERGTATLKAKGDLFTYLSKTGRTIKIAGAMMGGSWMGSHFTNDDLVRATRLVDSFDATVADGPAVDGQPTHLLTLVPRPDAPVVWGRIEAVVRKSDLMPTSELFYDEDGLRPECVAPRSTSPWSSSPQRAAKTRTRARRRRPPRPRSRRRRRRPRRPPRPRVPSPRR